MTDEVMRSGCVPNSLAISTRSLISASSASCAPGLVNPVVPPALPVPTRLTHLRPVSCCAFDHRLALLGRGVPEAIGLESLCRDGPDTIGRGIGGSPRRCEHDLDVDRDRVRWRVRARPLLLQDRPSASNPSGAAALARSISRRWIMGSSRCRYVLNGS